MRHTYYHVYVFSFLGLIATSTRRHTEDLTPTLIYSVLSISGRESKLLNNESRCNNGRMKDRQTKMANPSIPLAVCLLLFFGWGQGGGSVCFIVVSFVFFSTLKVSGLRKSNVSLSLERECVLTDISTI